MAEDLVGADLADAERDLVEGFAPPSYDSWTVLFDEYADLTTELLPHARALAADPRWVGFAQAALRAAAERGRQVREGSREYRPDRLFTQDEAGVLKRALLTALAVDADWVGLGIDAMDLASVAPGAAKTLPSQAAVYALARAIVSVPTPEAIAGMERVRTGCRNASVVKKLGKYVAEARAALPAMPWGLRVPEGATFGKRELGAWLTTLERGWLRDAQWTPDAWVATMYARPELADAASRLIWVADDGSSFLGARDAWVDASGSPVALPEATIRLWHPRSSDAQGRDLWRRRIIAERIDQPIRQIDREFYAEPFDVAGLRVDVHVLLGVARKEGWTSSVDEFSRKAGEIRVVLSCDRELNPTSEGQARLFRLEVRDAALDADFGHARPAEVPEGRPEVVLSELLRSADLLVSVSAVGIEASPEIGWDALPQTPHGILATRREILGHLLAELGDPSVGLDQRHVTVGPYRIHLATASVTRDGEQVEVTPARHDLWAPPDPLVNRILGTVVALRDA